MINNKLISDFLSARYVPDAQKALDGIAALDVSDQKKVLTVLSAILEQIENPKLSVGDPRFPNFTLPQKLVENNKLVREYLIKELHALQNMNPSFAQVQEFVIKHHENLKWAQNRWFIANPGITLEIVQITDSHPTAMLTWLHQLGVGEGDLTIHLHIISNNGRTRLADTGYVVPDQHWSEAYYRDMLEMAGQIMAVEKQCAGLFCDSSWVFQEQNFEVAPDGKPFVAFTFLKDRKLVGETLNITDVISKADYETQKNFALRSERRRKYFAEGLFAVRVHATFLPRSGLVHATSDY